MGQNGFYFDMTSCIGCKTCQVACKDINNLKVGTIFRKVTHYETGAYPKPGVYYYSSACNHCISPKCVYGCPTGAMHIAADGSVQHDESKCIGCKYCTWNCPYDAPKYIEETGKIGKCDGCMDLRNSGKNPACVDACAMRALHWGDLEEYKVTEKIEGVNELPLLPSSSITEPSLLIKPRTAALQSDYHFKDV